MTLDSMKEWLASWGNGPNWSDSTGGTIPVTKESLRDLIASAEKMRAALLEIRERVLCRVPGSARDHAPRSAAAIATICDDALEC